MSIRHRAASAIRAAAPVLLLCAAAFLVSMTVNALLPGVSPLIVAIVAGIALTNVVRLPASTAPGLALASKKLLRLGIVFLGLQLALSDIIALGVPILGVIVCIVVGGVAGTLALGRMLRMAPAQVLLIACGFSICGAAAVAGVEGVTDAEEEEVVTAVALVVIFGTLMISFVPFAARVLGLDPQTAGMWAGGSIHEIAQVVAAGGIIGGVALGVAVTVKLAWVLLLAPVVAVLSVRRRHRGLAVPNGRRPPVMPLFVVGFVIMIALRSMLVLPDGVITAGGFVQTALLSAAMFGRGCGVKVRALIRVGVKPFVLAAASTVLVSGIALAGVVVTGLI